MVRNVSRVARTSSNLIEFGFSKTPLVIAQAHLPCKVLIPHEGHMSVSIPDILGISENVLNVFPEHNTLSCLVIQHGGDVDDSLPGAASESLRRLLSNGGHDLHSRLGPSSELR
jgi:hypothetical protein